MTLLQAGPLTQASDAFLQAGLTGALCVIFGVVIVVLWRDAKEERTALITRLEAIQNLRVQESKEVQDKLIGVVEKCTSALTNVGATMEQSRETMIEVRNAIRELAAEVRDS